MTTAITIGLFLNAIILWKIYVRLDDMHAAMFELDQDVKATLPHEQRH